MTHTKSNGMARFARLSLAALVATGALATFSVAAHADKLDAIKERGVLICGVMSTNPPQGMLETGTREVVGYDVDVCRGIAAQLGVSADLKVMSTAARIPELTQGRVDILTAGFIYTAERAAQVDYSYSYLDAVEKIVVAEDSEFRSIADLSGHKVAAADGTTSANAARASIEGVEVITLQDNPTAFLAFMQNRADAFAASQFILADYVRTSQDTRPLRILPEATMSSPFGAAVRKDEPRLLEAVNAALVAMDRSGQFDEIFAKWLGPDSNYNLERTFVVQEIE
ncbi:transporter substrate-binding domain-containing protein [Pelagibacterium sediminicola]|uniref:transporter substrate-binding domain-containing protein n=1 Tax=Pelagibacterium sediminicola TaxID=2248761 RepID=UPI0013005DEB|nr:transporter substrate-binding domain-containing protein [Pelagibacterium sediminicola]